MRHKRWAEMVALFAMIGAASSRTIPSALVCVTVGALGAWYSGIFNNYERG